MPWRAGPHRALVSESERAGTCATQGNAVALEMPRAGNSAGLPATIVVGTSELHHALLDHALMRSRRRCGSSWMKGAESSRPPASLLHLAEQVPAAGRERALPTRPKHERRAGSTSVMLSLRIRQRCPRGRVGRCRIPWSNNLCSGLSELPAVALLRVLWPGVAVGLPVWWSAGGAGRDRGLRGRSCSSRAAEGERASLPRNPLGLPDRFGGGSMIRVV